jgi:hypothetical protein
MDGGEGVMSLPAHFLRNPDAPGDRPGFLIGHWAARHLEVQLHLTLMVALMPEHVLEQEDRVVVVKVHPCPFCDLSPDAVAELRRFEGMQTRTLHQVICRCGATGPVRSTPTEAANAWNAPIRATMRQAAPALAANGLALHR